MDWEQFVAAMRGIGFLVANATLDNVMVCQMNWRCATPECVSSAQLVQPARELRASPVLAFIFELAMDIKRSAEGGCTH